MTAFIQNNETSVVGVPYRAPISAKLIVVMTTQPNTNSLSAGSFSYEVYDAIEYPIWFKPFVGRDEWMWYCALGAFVSLPFLIITFCVCCCKYSKCCRKNCTCCVSECCGLVTDEEKGNSDKSKKLNKVSIV